MEFVTSEENSRLKSAVGNTVNYELLNCICILADIVTSQNDDTMISHHYCFG